MKMKIKEVLFVLFLKVSLLLGSRRIINEKVEFYRKIWNENIAAAQNYQMPVENVKFKNSSREHCKELAGHYDFVIVGAGSAGCVLAARLSEMSNWNILLLETGEDETDFSKIPAASDALRTSDMHWGYLTVPQKNGCFINIDQRCMYARGKVLGGCSSINGLVHNRGNKLDFELWAKLGNSRWSYKDVLPYFKKSEQIKFKADFGYHGYSGPLQITYQKAKPNFSKYIIEAYKEIGYKTVDYNGREQFGISESQVNIGTNGSRFSTNQGYLQPARKRKNLKVLTKALVTKVLLENLTAVGVEFLYEGHCFHVKPKNEIILSAGAVNTPQILMLSGIGPKTHLESIGIDTRVDLPVGKNLYDHPTLLFIPFQTNLTFPPINFTKSLEDYVLHRPGYLNFNPGQEISYVKTNNDTSFPDVEIIFNTVMPFIPGDVSKKSMSYSDEIDPHMNTVNVNDLIIHFMLLHPKSFGSVTLNTSEPTDFPLIDPKYLDNPDDLNTLLVAVKKTLKLLETSAFKKINVTQARIPIKKCLDLEEDEYWKCIIRYKISGIMHPMSTCKMGNRNDSVVDQNLNVYGVKNLRVVDAGVIPHTTSGHLNSVVVMIAEKISHRIKKDYMRSN